MMTTNSSRKINFRVFGKNPGPERRLSEYKSLLSKPDDLSSMPTLRKEARTSSTEMAFDLHICTRLPSHSYYVCTTTNC